MSLHSAHVPWDPLSLCRKGHQVLTPQKGQVEAGTRLASLDHELRPRQPWGTSESRHVPFVARGPPSPKTHTAKSGRDCRYFQDTAWEALRPSVCNQILLLVCCEVRSR